MNRPHIVYQALWAMRPGQRSGADWVDRLCLSSSHGEEWVLQPSLGLLLLAQCSGTTFRMKQRRLSRRIVDGWSSVCSRNLLRAVL